jgi:hypothetical protein
LLFPVQNLSQLHVDVSLQRISVVDDMRLEIVDWFKGLAPGGPQ